MLGLKTGALLCRCDSAVSLGDAVCYSASRMWGGEL